MYRKTSSIMPEGADSNAFQARQDREQKLLLIMLLGLFSILLQVSPISKQPYHTSSLSGEKWVLELLQGHPGRIHHELGIYKHIFLKLIAELVGLGYSPSRYITLEEQLAIFLYTCRTGLSIRHIAERFQRSSDTISKYALYNILCFLNHC